MAEPPDKTRGTPEAKGGTTEVSFRTALKNSLFNHWMALTVALLILVFLASLLRPASCPVRENAKRANCKSNLRQIGLALHIYSDDYAGTCPPSFRELYPHYVDNARLYKCPSDDSVKSRAFADASGIAKSSYAYVPGLSPAMPDQMIVAYDKSLKHHSKAGRNVLFVDAHVEWWPAAREAEFQKLLVEQRAAVEAWRKSGKPVESLKEFLKPVPGR
jgi:prepilin-type processing-associated H-X9-DG protein